MSAPSASWAAPERSIAKRDGSSLNRSKCRYGRPSPPNSWLPMTQRLAYLDWNATAPVRAEVRAAMAETLAGTGNPSSVHRFGREAKRVLEQARTRVARLVNASSSDIVFTSGGTE